MTTAMDFARLDADGYQVVRSVVPLQDIAAALEECERLKALVLADGAPDPRVRALWSSASSGTPILRGLQNAHCISPVIDALRLHPGIGRMLWGILGPDIRTVVTSIFWKAPGEPETGIAYHQDAAFRQPPAAYRNLARSYLQLALALDPQDDENGGLRFVRGTHRGARILPRPQQSVLIGTAAEAELRAMGLAPESVRTVSLAPGDVVLWRAFTVHGSSPNRSRDRDRRSFTIASMRTADCDEGIDAYRAGAPVRSAARKF